MRNQAVDEYVMDVMGAVIHKAWVGRSRLRSYQSEFLSKGFVILPMDGVSRELLLRCYDESNRITLTETDCAPGYYTFPFNSGIIAELNRKHHFYSPPPPDAKSHLEAFLERNAEFIERQIGSPFEVCNVRIEALLAGNSFGPSQWHHDGGPRFLRKILLYPGPLDRERYGALEFFDRAGGRHILESDQPIAVLYDTSLLLHRGHPPKDRPRAMIEITLKPARATSVRAVFPGHLARVPEVGDDELDSTLLKIKQHRLAEVEAANGAANGRAAALPPSKLQRLMQRIATLRKRSLSQLLEAARRRMAKPVDASDMRETQVEGPLCYIGGQISNRASMVNIGATNGGLGSGWLNWELDPAEPAGSARNTIPAATRSISFIYTGEPLPGAEGNAFVVLLEECRRVLSLDGCMLAARADGLADDAFQAMLARHGFAVASTDQKRIRAEFKWVPWLERSGRYCLLKCA